jgi:hypothetical protein
MAKTLKSVLRRRHKQGAKTNKTPRGLSEISPTPPTPPPPGEGSAPAPAQPTPGNRRTHGFYSQFFTPEELSLITSCLENPTLDDELWMQRVVNRRLLTYISGKDTHGGAPALDAGSMARVAMAMAVGTGRVARLLRDRQVLSGDLAKQMLEAIMAAMADLTTELGRDLSKKDL